MEVIGVEVDAGVAVTSGAEGVVGVNDLLVFLDGHRCRVHCRQWLGLVVLA